jgi:hypothetical protein
MTSAKEAATPPTAAVSTAKAGPIMAYSFIGYHKTMVFEAKPFTAFRTMDSISPVNDMRNEEYP